MNNVMTAPRRRWSFSLRTLLFWIVPYAAICISIMSCEMVAIDPGPPETDFDWHRRIAVLVVTLLWAVLFWEDQRARKLDSE
jgi:hypothetical protein